MILLAKRKKIVLFIVEGITDEVSLALGFSELMNSDEVKFELTRGDITTRANIKVDTIAKEIGNIVNRFRGKIYKKSDIKRVIHLVDTDGCFIEDDKVVKKDVEITYFENKIDCKNPDYIRQRNKKKSEILDRMARMHKVCSEIDYSVYFMSCNLEHVLHDNANMTNEQKNEAADAFRAKYDGKAEEFAKLFSDEKIAVKGDYKETWDYIKQGNNSLKRCTNLNILISEL